MNKQNLVTLIDTSREREFKSLIANAFSEIQNELLNLRAELKVLKFHVDDLRKKK